MIVKPDKFQAMISQNSRNSKNYEIVKLEIGRAKIETKHTVKQLGTIIDNKLNMYLNYAKKPPSLQRFMGKEKKEALVNSFIFSNLIAVFPLVSTPGAY